MSNCRDCRNWRDCVHDGLWFHYGEIKFCSKQIFWVLQHGEDLEKGIWPQPVSVETVRFGKFGHEGYFVKATIIIGEVRHRLKFTGWRGRLLAEQCINREKMLYLDDDAKAALYYISGSKAKARSFSSWLKDRKHYERAKV